MGSVGALHRTSLLYGVILYVGSVTPPRKADYLTLARSAAMSWTLIALFARIIHEGVGRGRECAIERPP